MTNGVDRDVLFTDDTFCQSQERLQACYQEIKKKGNHLPKAARPAMTTITILLMAKRKVYIFHMKRFE